MAKAVKTVGTVLGAVALVAGTIATGGALGIVGAGLAATAGTVATVASIGVGILGVASSAIAPSQKPPPARGSVSQLIIDPNAPQPYVMGEGYYAGVLRHRVSYGGTIDKIPNPYLFDAVVYSGGGPVQGIAPRVDFGPIPSWYSGYLYTDTKLGACPEASAIASHWANAPYWGPDHRLSGQAAGGWSFKFDKEGKKFASGLPVTGYEGQWVKAYDPRKDSTFPGGSGPHRIGVEITYEWTANPALHAGTYAFGRWQNGKRTIGMGLPGEAIDWEVIAAWANTCDANGWRMFGVVYEGSQTDRWANLVDICAAGGAEPVPGAVLGFRYQAPRVALDTIRESDIADQDSSACPMRSYRDRINSVVPRRLFPELNWELLPDKAVVVPEYVAADGEDRPQEWPFNFVRDGKQASELAAYKLVDAREIHPIELVCMPRLRGYRPGDCLHVNLPQMGLDHDCIILWREFDPGTMTVRFILMSETPSKHAYALGHPGAVPPQPGLVMTSEQRDIVAANNVPLDPNATFGAPPGTPVGDRPAEQVIEEIESAKARLAALDAETIPAINDKIADANEQIVDAGERADEARKRADAARELAADGHTRIDTLVDETGDIKAEVERVVIAYTDADRSLAEESTRIEASIGPAINAKADEIRTAYTDADSALAEETRRVEASISPAINASAQQLTQAFTDQTSAIVTQTNNLEARFNAGGNKNLLPNGSGEMGLAKWSTQNQNSWTTVSDQDGTYFWLGGDGTGNFILESDPIPLSSSTYTLAHEMNNSGNPTAYCDAVCRNAAGAIILDVPQQESTGPTQFGNRGARAQTFVAPSGTATITVRIFGFKRAAGDRVRCRSIKLEVGDEPTAYSTESTITEASARLRTVEIAVTDGRFATAQRASNIETEIANAKARISNVETATTDGRFATAQRVNTLEASVGGFDARITEQAGVIAGVDGRTAVYWQVDGSTGDGGTRISLSKKNGERGLFYVGADMLIDGNLSVINGSIYTEQLAPNSVTTPYFYESADVYCPVGVTTTVLNMPSSLTIGDAMGGGCVLMLFGEIDSVNNSDLGLELRIFADTGSGMQQVAVNKGGVLTVGANTRFDLPISLAHALNGSQVRVMVTARPYIVSGASDTRPAWFRNTKLIIFGGKR